MQSGAQHDLPGHQAEVLALAATAGMLFSGGKDNSIRAWQFDAASSTFRPTVRALCLPDLQSMMLQSMHPLHDPSGQCKGGVIRKKDLSCSASLVHGKRSQRDHLAGSYAACMSTRGFRAEDSAVRR